MASLPCPAHECQIDDKVVAYKASSPDPDLSYNARLRRQAEGAACWAALAEEDVALRSGAQRSGAMRGVEACPAFSETSKLSRPLAFHRWLSVSLAGADYHLA
jgi:hypothetical protein